MEQWERIEPTVVSKVGYRVIITKTFKMPDGNIMTWDTKEPEGAQTAAVIALTPDCQVIIACQYRVGIEGEMYELPGGGVDPDENPEAAARRELSEETNYTAGMLVYLGFSRKDAYSNTISHFYMATDCVLDSKEKYIEPGEFIEPRLISIDDLISNARTGKMTDSEAVLLAYEQLLAVQGKKIVNKG